MRRHSRPDQTRTKPRSDQPPAMDAADAPIPFPLRVLRVKATKRAGTIRNAAAFPRLARTSEQVLAAFDDVSRRMEDLARELNCLGYFDEDEDRPKAA